MTDAQREKVDALRYRLHDQADELRKVVKELHDAYDAKAADDVTHEIARDNEAGDMLDRQAKALDRIGGELDDVLSYY